METKKTANEIVNSSMSTSSTPPLLPLLQFTPSTKKRDTSISMKNGFVGKAWKNIFICKVHFQKMK